MDRKMFFKTLQLSVGATLLCNQVGAAETVDSEKSNLLGLLIDTTRCLGCRACEFACAEANGLPEPDDDESVLDNQRKTSETQLTVINRCETDAGEVFVKKQCMHCVQPACTAACLTKAMYKTSEGPVIWRGEKCMGCRFCMISCPFDIPKFEYNSAVPKILKCRMCFDRLQKGEQPACVENCFGDEALLFGNRSDLLQTARSRICSEPEKYISHIYGEHEVGGTECLYLASVPFEKLGFRNDLGTKPFPELTKQFLYTVPVVVTLLPPFLLALSRAYGPEKNHKEGEE
ncbi:MAG: 4Fe-4S dicluster domain-containing protein [Candidatus Glassbacteria bacterium]|nr:4Fe-4S dicluster domain-containing protein [Candidatus Glassbacteria bacterium]